MTEEIAPQLRVLAPLLEDRIQFPALMSGYLEPPVTPAPKDPIYTHVHIPEHRYAEIHIVLKSITRAFNPST